MALIPDARYVSVRQAALYLGVSRPTIYNLLADHTLTSVKLRGRRLVSHDGLIAFADALESEAT